MREIGATVLAVSADPPEEARGWAERLPGEVIVLSDPEGEVIGEYGLIHEEAGRVRGRRIARPATLLVGRDGTIVWTHIPTNYRLRPAAGEVLEKLESIR